jgi:hypothetical protein
MRLVLILAAVILLAGAAMAVFIWRVHRVFGPVPPVGKGDANNQRLHQLAADPIFHALPRSARSAETKLSPAKWTQTGFGHGGWSGPSVTLTFESTEKPLAIYTYYGEQAPAHGWTAFLQGALHVTDRWRKTYPNGAKASLSIGWRGPLDPPPGPITYELVGSILLPVYPVSK